jgi:hypothetical protein
MAPIINPLTSSIQLLKDFGFFQVALPMILVFAVLYGILLKTKIFGDIENAQSLCAVIAFSAAFFVVTETTIVKAINQFIPQASFLLIVVMLFLMLIAFFGVKTETFFGTASKWVWIPVIILSVIFIAVLGNSLGWFNLSSVSQLVSGSGGGGGISSEAFNQATGMGISLAILVGLPLIIIWLMVKKSSP